MTSLQKQLKAIAASSTNQLDLKAQKAAHGKSLLYEPRVAASQSFDSIYLICSEGFRDLCALDQRFVPYARTLFSEQSKSEDRNTMNKQENAELDLVLESFITLVGPRILLKPAEKALEWLVRRFRVHEYNTECLVLTYLPYHATPQFLALLSILPPSPPIALRFLFPYLKPTSNPPRRTIVYTATNTPQFFAALQAYVVKVLQAGHQGPTLLSFWSGITAQAIDAILEQSNTGRGDIKDNKKEEVLLRVLPVLNECLQMTHVNEAIMGSYMIAIILASKGGYQDKVLDSLMEAVVRGQTPETLEGCIMCLAVIAEERSQPSFPAPVAKRLLKIPDLVSALKSSSKQSRTDRLALGCALGALENIGRSSRQEESLALFQNILGAELVDNSLTSICLSALLQLIRSSSLGSAQHAQLIDLVTKLGESPTTSRILQALVKDHSTEFEALGVSLQHPLAIGEKQEHVDEDEEMLDADLDVESIDTSIAPPKITTNSFLDAKSSESFQATLSAFEQVVGVKSRIGAFLNSEELGRSEASEKPLFLSFLVRTWCSPASPAVRVVAIRSATALIQKLDSGVDLQHLVPYLLCALADSSPAVRRAAATCISTLSEKSTDANVWGSSDLYGKESSKLSALPKGQLSSLLTSVFIPVLEECVMDPNFVLTSVRSLFEGAQASKVQPLKSAAKSALITFLASHVAVTPILRVRLCLLPLFEFVGKSTSAARTNTLLPVVRGWCSLPAADVSKWCESEKLEATDVDRKHLSVLMARETESVELLKDIVSSSINTERADLLDAAFERLVALWPSLKSDTRVPLSLNLLEIALKKDSTNGVEELCKTRSLETLRTVKLDTAVLLELIESAPSSMQMPEGPPTKRRRRTSRSEMARVEKQSPDDITRQIRRLTFVLELVEGSNPGEHTILFRNLFAILGDLPQLRQQSGSDLVYLQSLVLGSLTPMVNQLKDARDTESQACIRADLLIDCIRHSTSPQVQNAALLLVASLASWVPELVLHNLMPIFTFIGSTLLRQTDDYSAHVVDQTISRVVPQLAASLRAKNKDFLAGIADLLLSFTAAFEHIPHHRRLKLFSELAQTLGPDDSLSAIIALLIDRYSTTTALRKFVPELLLKFEPVVTLQTFKGYLGLVTDAVSSTRKISDTLLSLNEKQPAQIENTVHSLLSSLADLATDKSIRAHINKGFRRSRDPTRPRKVFADIVEATIQLSKKVTGSRRLFETCSRVLANCLDLLPTADLIQTAELLLTSPDQEVAIAVVKSVELRAGHVTQNDQPSVSALLSFLPRVDELLQKSTEIDVKLIAVSCIDRIVERFGKKDTSAVIAVARTISGKQSLSSEDDRVRILSLLCLTSVVDVLESDAIPLLPVVLPTAFAYLEESIKKNEPGLHNAVFALLSNVVERLSFVFTREYLVPALELAQTSAASDMDESCDEARQQFYQSVSNYLGAQEAFAAITATWSSASSRGYEASQELLDLLLATIEHQSKSNLIKASSILFTLLLEMFNLRHAIMADESEDYYDEESMEQLDTTLIESVIAMTLKLNDSTFRPFFVQLVDSAAATQEGEVDAERSITLCKFLAMFFDRFKSIVTTYSSYIIEPLSNLLTHLALTSTPAYPTLRKSLLSALHNSFQHDQDSFWQAPSHYTAILAPLLQQLTIDYASFPASTDSSDSSSDILATSVIPAITELATASMSSMDNHRQMNAILLKYMRSENAHTRLATVKCEQNLTKELGEEWLGLLPEMLPFISELREDDDEIVERETQRWIGMVEEVLGEDLEGMLQ